MATVIDIETEEGYAQVDGEPFHAGKRISVNIKEKSLNLLLPNTLTEEKIKSL